MTVRDYLDHIAVGGWPLLVGAGQDAARTYVDGYLDVIVEHDIDEVSGGVRNPRLVRRFIHAYAQMVAQTANLSTIMRRAHDDAGLADVPSHAEAAGASRFHYREAEGRVEVDYVLETRNGDWIGIEVKLGDAELDKAATSLRRLAERVARKPAALVVVTGTRWPTPVTTACTSCCSAFSGPDHATPEFGIRFESTCRPVYPENVPLRSRQEL